VVERGRSQLRVADLVRTELESNPALDRLLDAAREAEPVTLLYAARDPECNHAAVLRDFAGEALAA